MEQEVISTESVRRAAEAMERGDSRGVSMDANNVSVRCHTVTGDGTMTFSRKKIVEEARKAFARMRQDGYAAL